MVNTYQRGHTLWISRRGHLVGPHPHISSAHTHPPQNGLSLSPIGYVTVCFAMGNDLPLWSLLVPVAQPPRVSAVTVSVGVVHLVVLLKLLHLRDGDVEVAAMLCVAPVDPQTTQQHQSSANGHHDACHHQATSLHMQQQRLPQLWKHSGSVTFLLNNLSILLLIKTSRWKQLPVSLATWCFLLAEKSQFFPAAEFTACGMLSIFLPADCKHVAGFWAQPTSVGGKQKLQVSKQWSIKSNKSQRKMIRPVDSPVFFLLHFTHAQSVLTKKYWEVLVILPEPTAIIIQRSTTYLSIPVNHYILIYPSETLHIYLSQWSIIYLFIYPNEALHIYLYPWNITYLFILVNHYKFIYPREPLHIYLFQWNIKNLSILVNHYN